MVNRRDALKLSGAAAALGLLSAQEGVAATEDAQSKIKLAGYPYDRVQAIKDGVVGMEQAAVSFHNENIYSLNDLALGSKHTYEVTELGLIPYITKYVDSGYRSYTLVPVFISRSFRHRNIYVHVDAGIEKPEDLKGRKVGTPAYGASSNTWVRGLLHDQYGVAPADMQWIETVSSSDIKGTVSTTSGGGSRYQLPDDFPLEFGPPGVDESDLLLSGGCDALVTAITPKAVIDGNPNIRPLFTDAKSVEQQYFRDTGLFPIMHVIAVRKDVAADNPWLPTEIFRMYSEAKKIAYANLETTTVLRTSLPWALDEYQQTTAVMGSDYWRYGIESNRKELGLLMRYAYEQGLVKKLGDFEEMFHPSTLELLG